MSAKLERGYGYGYQAALKDLAEAYERGGSEDLWRWLANNTNNPDVYATAVKAMNE